MLYSKRRCRATEDIEADGFARSDIREGKSGTLLTDVERPGRDFRRLSSGLITPTGDPASGYAVTFQVGVSV